MSEKRNILFTVHFLPFQRKSFNMLSFFSYIKLCSFFYFLSCVCFCCFVHACAIYKSKCQHVMLKQKPSAESQLLLPLGKAYCLCWPSWLGLEAEIYVPVCRNSALGRDFVPLTKVSWLTGNFGEPGTLGLSKVII